MQLVTPCFAAHAGASNKLPPAQASKEQVKHALRGSKFRAAKNHGIIVVAKCDVQLHELYNTVKRLGGYACVAKVGKCKHCLLAAVL